MLAARIKAKSHSSDVRRRKICYVTAGCSYQFHMYHASTATPAAAMLPTRQLYTLRFPHRPAGNGQRKLLVWPPLCGVSSLQDIPLESTLMPPASGSRHNGGAPSEASTDTDRFVVPPLAEWGSDSFLMSGCEAGKKLRVAVLLSGGVDSSLALRLLKAAGHDCVAFYLQIWFEEDFRNFWDQCPWEEDLGYAGKVCEALGVPLEVVPLTSAYWDHVVSTSVAEIRDGHTPNPDMLCNTRVKFGAFYDYLETRHGNAFDRIASGHYARLLRVPAAEAHQQVTLGPARASSNESGSSSSNSSTCSHCSGAGHATSEVVHQPSLHAAASPGGTPAADEGAAGMGRRPARDGGLTAGTSSQHVAALCCNGEQGRSHATGSSEGAAGCPAASEQEQERGGAASRQQPGAVPSAGHVLLTMTPDAVKDQTYFLAHLSQAQLQRVMFPLGPLTKPQVRALAHAAGLANKDRRDSQGICFLGKVKFPEFVKEHLGEWPGLIVEEESGGVLGAHRGFWFYTLGQRGGIKLPGGPWYVVRKDTTLNVVHVSRQYHSGNHRRDAFVAGPFSWTGGGRPAAELLQSPGLRCKVRHGPHTYSCTLELPDDSVDVLGTIRLDATDQGLAPGQHAVLYHDGVCLGAGKIQRCV